MNVRRQQARDIRQAATELAYARPHLPHANNGEEFLHRDGNGKNAPTYIANFTKGLPHDVETGLLIDAEDYKQFVLGIQSGGPSRF